MTRDFVTVEQAAYDPGERVAVRITAGENRGRASRGTYLDITNGRKTERVLVTQAGAAAELYDFYDVSDVPAAGGDAMLWMSGNVMGITVSNVPSVDGLTMAVRISEGTRTEEVRGVPAGADAYRYSFPHYGLNNEYTLFMNLRFPANEGTKEERYTVRISTPTVADTIEWTIVRGFTQSSLSVSKSTIAVEAGASSDSFVVSSARKFTVSCSSYWLRVDTGEFEAGTRTISVTADANTLSAQRQATVTVADGINTKTVTVTQAGKAAEGGSA